jgi:hypothetical protein
MAALLASAEPAAAPMTVSYGNQHSTLLDSLCIVSQLAMMKRAEEAGDAASEASHECEGNSLLNSDKHEGLPGSRLARVKARLGPKEVHLIDLDDEPVTPATPAAQQAAGEAAMLDGPAEGTAELVQEVMAVKKMVMELQRMWADEASHQRYMIHQVRHGCVSHVAGWLVAA